MVNGRETHGACRHRRVLGFSRVLHDCDAAAVVYGLEADCSVVEIAGQQYADDAGAMRASSGAKQRVDCRAEAVFLRPAKDAESIPFDQQMVVGWRDVDATPADFFPV